MMPEDIRNWLISEIEEKHRYASYVRENFGLDTQETIHMCIRVLKWLEDNPEPKEDSLDYAISLAQNNQDRLNILEADILNKKIEGSQLKGGML